MFKKFQFYTVFFKFKLELKISLPLYNLLNKFKIMSRLSVCIKIIKNLCNK